MSEEGSLVVSGEVGRSVWVWVDGWLRLGEMEWDGGEL
jgi:hypothetical protein